MFSGEDESSRSGGGADIKIIFYNICLLAVQEERGPRKQAKFWRPQDEGQSHHSGSRKEHCAVTHSPSLVAGLPATSSEVVLHTLVRLATHPAISLLPPVVKHHAVKRILPQMFLLNASLASWYR